MRHLQVAALEEEVQSLGRQLQSARSSQSTYVSRLQADLAGSRSRTRDLEARLLATQNASAAAAPSSPEVSTVGSGDGQHTRREARVNTRRISRLSGSPAIPQGQPVSNPDSSVSARSTARLQKIDAQLQRTNELMLHDVQKLETRYSQDSAAASDPPRLQDQHQKDAMPAGVSDQGRLQDRQQKDAIPAGATDQGRLQDQHQKDAMPAGASDQGRCQHQQHKVAMPAAAASAMAIPDGAGKQLGKPAAKEVSTNTAARVSGLHQQLKMAQLLVEQGQQTLQGQYAATQQSAALQVALTEAADELQAANLLLVQRCNALQTKLSMAEADALLWQAERAEMSAAVAKLQEAAPPQPAVAQPSYDSLCRDLEAKQAECAEIRVQLSELQAKVRQESSINGTALHEALQRKRTESAEAWAECDRLAAQSSALRAANERLKGEVSKAHARLLQHVADDQPPLELPQSPAAESAELQEQQRSEQKQRLAAAREELAQQTACAEALRCNLDAAVAQCEALRVEKDALAAELSDANARLQQMQQAAEQQLASNSSQASRVPEQIPQSLAKATEAAGAQAEPLAQRLSALQDEHEALQAAAAEEKEMLVAQAAALYDQLCDGEQQHSRDQQLLASQAARLQDLHSQVPAAADITAMT